MVVAGPGWQRGAGVECGGGEAVGGCQLLVSGTGAGCAAQKTLTEFMNVPPRNMGLIFDSFLPLNTSSLAPKPSQVLSVYLKPIQFT